MSIFLTFFWISFIDYFFTKQILNLYSKFIIVSFPVFIFGFLEDITQSISPRLRLFATILSAITFYIIFRITIQKIEIEVIDFLLDYKSFAICFTIFCIVFLTQAFNIIDGLNGLSLTSCILSLFTVGIISYQIGDVEFCYDIAIFIFIF